MSSEGGGLASRVRDEIVKLVREEGLVAGDRLPSAERLCERYGVSRTVVREAVAHLTAQGFLRSRRGSGVFVNDPEAQSPPPVHFDWPTDMGDVLDVLELRLSVEVEAAGLAAERRTEAHLAKMDTALAAFGRSMDDLTVASTADRSFHEAIANATGNPQFELFLARLGERMLPRKALGVNFDSEEARRDFARTIDAEHQAIYRAIVERAADEARQAMRLHLGNSSRRYRQWRVAMQK